MALSDRTRHLLDNYEPCKYSAAEAQCRKNPFDTHSRPDGYIDVSVAENKIMWDFLQNKLQDFTLHRNDFEYADEWYGSSQLRERIADFLQEFLKVPATSESLVVGCGASALLEMLFWCLCDQGDAVLVLAPYYVNFAKVFGYRNRIHLIPVYPLEDLHLITAGFGSYVAPLENAMQAALAEGRRVRAVLLSNPTNPLGLVANEPELRALIEWCIARGVHCVIDEVYALSVHDHDHPWVSGSSVAKMLGGAAPSLVHTIYSFSKDFASSGLRCGVLHSSHDDLLVLLRLHSRFHSCSTLTQTALLHLITTHTTQTDVDTRDQPQHTSTFAEYGQVHGGPVRAAQSSGMWGENCGAGLDRAWLSQYISSLQQRLAHNVSALRAVLDDAQVPYVHSRAGFFLMAHISPAIGRLMAADIEGRHTASVLFMKQQDQARHSTAAEHTASADMSVVPTAEVAMRSAQHSDMNSDESVVWKWLLQHARVLLWPGLTTGMPAPGWFRICVAVPQAVVVELARRLHILFTAASPHHPPPTAMPPHT